MEEECGIQMTCSTCIIDVSQNTIIILWPFSWDDEEEQLNVVNVQWMDQLSIKIIRIIKYFTQKY